MFVLNMKVKSADAFQFFVCKISANCFGNMLCITIICINFSSFISLSFLLLDKVSNRSQSLAPLNI